MDFRPASPAGTAAVTGGLVELRKVPGRDAVHGVYTYRMNGFYANQLPGKLLCLVSYHFEVIKFAGWWSGGRQC